MRKATYKLYKVILDDYANRSGIGVYYKKLDAEAQWQPRNKTIYLDINIEEYDREIANYLHELGHMRDDYTPKKDKHVDQIEKAYNRFNQMLEKVRVNGRLVYPTYNQKMTVIETEYRAWINGKAIAMQLNLKLGDWYDKQMLESMYIYFEHSFDKRCNEEYNQFMKEKGEV